MPINVKTRLERIEDTGFNEFCLSQTVVDSIISTSAQIGKQNTIKQEKYIEFELVKKSGAVIACGGGAVTREFNYAPLHQNGVIIFIERELQKLATGGRPLSQKMPVSELYAARIDKYHRFADIEVKSTEIPEKTANAILDALVGYVYVK